MYSVLLEAFSAWPSETYFRIPHIKEEYKVMKTISIKINGISYFSINVRALYNILLLLFC